MTRHPAPSAASKIDADWSAAALANAHASRVARAKVKAMSPDLELEWEAPGVPVKDFAPVAKDEPRLWDEAFGDDEPEQDGRGVIAVLAGGIVAALIAVALRIWGVI